MLNRLDNDILICILKQLDQFCLAVLKQTFKAIHTLDHNGVTVEGIMRERQQQEDNEENESFAVIEAKRKVLDTSPVEILDPLDSWSLSEQGFPRETASPDLSISLFHGRSASVHELGVTRGATPFGNMRPVAPDDHRLTGHGVTILPVHHQVSDQYHGGQGALESELIASFHSFFI